jgi:hypothetical protein
MVSPNDPTANACKVVDFHGEKIASFNIHGKTMLCLPQAFEIFLKNLVGGLHTVYTKCKRLDIHPLVCNVEQVYSAQLLLSSLLFSNSLHCVLSTLYSILQCMYYFL